MLKWFGNLYNNYHSVVEDAQVICDDLVKLKNRGFSILHVTKDEDTLVVLRFLNQVIDSELAARRYKQTERRIQHTFVLAVFSLIGGGVGVIILKLFV